MTAIHSHASAGLRALAVRLAAPQVLFPLITVFLLLVIWSTAFGVIKVKEADASHAAAASTSVLLSAYEALAVRALTQIDQTLNLVKYWPRRTAGHTLAELKSKGLLPPDLLFTVSIADVNGNIVDTTHPSAKQNVVGQDIFLKARDSESFVIGRLPRGPTGDTQLQFSRRLNDPNGAFNGAVIVSVEAAYFVSGYDPLKLGEHGVLSMIGVDGISQVRRTGDAMFSGESIDYAAAIQDPDAVATDATVSIGSSTAFPSRYSWDCRWMNRWPPHIGKHASTWSGQPWQAPWSWC
jgi:hypothetical protein